MPAQVDRSSSLVFTRSGGLVRGVLGPLDQRYDPCYWLYNDIVYVGGGFNIIDSIQSFMGDVIVSGNSKTWSTVKSNAAWSARSRAACWVYDDKMWIAGGFSGGPTYYNDVWYSTDGATWTQATASAAWGTRASAGVWTYDNKMWIAGGSNEAVDYNDVWYSTDGATWTQATASAAWGNRAIGLGRSLVYGGKMWIVNGSRIYPSSLALSDVWYSTDGATWTRATATTPFVGAISSWSYGGKIFVANTIEVHSSTDGATWTQITSGAPLKFVLLGNVSYVFADKMYLSFGQRNGIGNIYNSSNGIDWKKIR